MIQDKLGRTFKNLRVSLTDVCNLGCTYCTSGGIWKEKRSGLSVSDYTQIISRLHQTLLLETVRLTGGEPLLFKDIGALIENVSSLPSSPNVRMTTNGLLLADRVEALQSAGLSSVNVSLDATNSNAFLDITRVDALKVVTGAIEKCIEVGLPIKINAVIQKGVNDDELIPLLDFAISRNVDIRFLEVMKMGHLYEDHGNKLFSEEKMLDLIKAKMTLTPVPRKENATATYWRTPGGSKVGFISNTSRPFCSDCNRLRLDSRGKLFGCISSTKGFDLSGNLDDSAKMESILEEALAEKQDVKFAGSPISMKHLGG